MARDDDSRVALTAAALLLLAAPLTGALLDDDPVRGFWLGLLTVPTGRYIVLASGMGPVESAPAYVLGLLAICSETGLAALVSVGANAFLFRVPLLGPALARLRERVAGEGPRRASRGALVGLLLFVVAPVPGSGAIGGALLGRVLGLTLPRILVSVAIGTALSVALLSGGAAALDVLFAPLGDPRLVVIVRVLVVVSVVGILGLVGRHVTASKP